MTPDQLRALADALHWVQYTADWQTCDQAADYLRAQADAQPVAVPAGWKMVPVEPTPEMLSAVGMMDGYDWHAPGCSPDADHATWYSAMIAAAPAVPQADALPVALVRAYNAGYMAGHHDTVEGGFVDIHPSDMDTYHADVVAELGLPAAPQAEPIDPHMIVAEDRFPDVPAEQWVTCSQCDGDFDRECPICDGLGKVLATDGKQAEPKRGPTCLWSRADDDTDVWETSCGHAFTIIEGTPGDNHMEFCCYCGRRVDEEIGGSDAE